MFTSLVQQQSQKKKKRNRLLGPCHKKPIVLLRVVRARAQVFGVHVCIFFFPFASPSQLQDDSGACAVLTEQGSSTSQMTAAKLMDVIARYKDALDKHLTQYQFTPRSKWRTLQGCSKFQSQNVVVTLSTTKVAQIMVTHRRPSDSSCTKSVRSPTRWSLVEKTTASMR